MTVEIVVAAVVFAVLIGGFAAFYRWSGTASFRRSEVRWAAVRFLMTVGPMFGVHIKPPRPEPPAVLTPGPDEPAEGPGGVADPAARLPSGPERGDGPALPG